MELYHGSSELIKIWKDDFHDIEDGEAFDVVIGSHFAVDYNVAAMFCRPKGYIYTIDVDVSKMRVLDIPSRTSNDQSNIFVHCLFTMGDEKLISSITNKVEDFLRRFIEENPQYANSFELPNHHDLKSWWYKYSERNWDYPAVPELIDWVKSNYDLVKYEIMVANEIEYADDPTAYIITKPGSLVINPSIKEERGARIILEKCNGG